MPRVGSVNDQKSSSAGTPGRMAPSIVSPSLNGVGTPGAPVGSAGSEGWVGLGGWPRARGAVGLRSFEGFDRLRRQHEEVEVGGRGCARLQVDDCLVGAGRK